MSVLRVRINFPNIALDFLNCLVSNIKTNHLLPHWSHWVFACLSYEVLLVCTKWIRLILLVPLLSLLCIWIMKILLLWRRVFEFFHQKVFIFILLLLSLLSQIMLELLFIFHSRIYMLIISRTDIIERWSASHLILAYSSQTIINLRTLMVCKAYREIRTFLILLVWIV